MLKSTILFKFKNNFDSCPQRTRKIIEENRILNLEIEDFYKLYSDETEKQSAGLQKENSS